MNLQPSEFIAKPPQRIDTYNMVPGTVVRLRNHIFVLVDASQGPHQWIHAKTGCSLSHEPGCGVTPPTCPGHRHLYRQGEQQ